MLYLFSCACHNRFVYKNYLDFLLVARALKEAGYNARAKSAYKVTSRVGAVWHIFRPQDAEKIREFLKKVFN